MSLLGHRAGFLLATALAVGLSCPLADAQSMTFLHTPPARCDPHRPLVLSGNVFGVESLARATLVYRVGDGPWERLPLTCHGADTYEATIPASEVTAPVSYYVVATDWSGRQSAIFASRRRPQRVGVAGAGEPAGSPPALPAPGPASSVTPAPVPPAGTAPSELSPAAGPPSSTAPGEGLGTPIPSGGRPVRIETWQPGGAPAAPSGGTAAGSSAALAEDLSLYAAEDAAYLAGRHRQAASDRPAIESVVTGAEMRALGLHTLIDVMKILPGFDTRRDVQGFWEVTVRGITSDPEILVLFDGQRMNDPYDGRVLWERPVDDLARIEVIRGPGSVLFGSGAFSAVVNLVPRRNDGFAARASYGSFGEVQASANGGHTFGGFSLDGSADFERRDGYQKTIAHDALTTDPDVPAGMTDDHRQGFDATLRGRYRFGKAGSLLKGSAQVLHEDRGALVGLIDVVGPGSDLGWNEELANLGLEAPVGSWKLGFDLDLDLDQTDRLFVLFPDGYTQGATVFPDGVREETKIGMESFGLRAGASGALFPGNRLTLGGQVERQAIADFGLTANLNGDKPTGGEMVAPAGIAFPQRNPADDARLVAGLFAQDEWRLAQPLLLTVGLRGDYVSGFGLSPSPRLALVYRPTRALSFQARFSRAFRAPTFQEYLSIVAVPPTLDSGQATGFQVDSRGKHVDPLRPVVLTTIQVGGEAAGAVAGQRATLGVDGFWNEFQDPISAVDSTGSPLIVNRDKGVRVVGVEAEGRYDLPAGGFSFANASWFRAFDLETDEVTPAFALLTDAPQLRANWGIVLPVLGLGSFTLLAEFGSERRNDDRTELEATRRYQIPAYGLLSASVRTRPLFSHLVMSVEVWNVTDLSYLDPVPRPDTSEMPGLLPGEGIHGLVSLRMGY